MRYGFLFTLSELERKIADEYCSGIELYGQDGDLLSSVGDSLSLTWRPALESLAVIICVLLLCAVLRAVRESSDIKGSDALELAGVLVCSLLIAGIIKPAYEAVSTAITGISTFMLSMGGVMAALYGLSGSVASGAAATSTLMSALVVLQYVNDSLLLPLVSVCFGTSLISGLRFKAGLDGVTAFIKRTVTFLCVAVSTVLGFVLSYQTVLAKAADTAALRGLKFTSSSFIPVIGAALSDSLSSVISAISTVRTLAGIGGVISIALLILPAAVLTVTDKLLMQACCLLCGILDLPSLGALFRDADLILSVLLSVMLCGGVLLIIACAVFAGR